MIKLKNIKTLKGTTEVINIDSAHDDVIDAEGRLLILPALIDTHSSLESDWIKGAKAALAGGITTLLDVSTDINIQINEALKNANIPLNYHQYLNVDSNNIREIGQLKKQIVGVNLVMDSSNKDLSDIFRICAQENFIIAIQPPQDRIAAIESVKHAIDIAEKYNAEIFITNISTKDELDLVKKAKKRGLLVYAGTTPFSLFIKQADHREEDRNALIKGVSDRVIDTIGSNGHFFKLMLPLLLNGVVEKKLKLEDIVILTRINPENIFNLNHNYDLVLVDLEKAKIIEEDDSPCAGMTLKGWPVYTISQGQIFHIETF